MPNSVDRSKASARAQHRSRTNATCSGGNWPAHFGKAAKNLFDRAGKDIHTTNHKHIVGAAENAPLE